MNNSINTFLDDDDESIRKAEWNRKIARMKREQKRARTRQRLILCFAAIILILIVFAICRIIIHFADKTPNANDISLPTSTISPTFETVPDTDVENEDADNNVDTEFNSNTYSYTQAPDYKLLGSDNMTSTNAILVNTDTGVIEGGRDYDSRIIPASMTKVLTVLVAAEHIDDVNAKVEVSPEATDYAYVNDCSSVGFAKYETVTIEDLFYGTILSSGGDAATQLAICAAGSVDAFVDMMNEKLSALGISDSAHFTNCVGVYDTEHYCSCYDMAVIMNAAIDNEYCRKIMSAHKYTTSSTVEHPDGITISNWFLRRIEDKDTSGTVLCAKTGYVVQSGNCGVSYSEQSNGTHYICVTADAHSAWRCIYDHVDILSHTVSE